MAGSVDGDLAAEASRPRGDLERRPGRARLRDVVALQRRPVETLVRRRRTGGPLFPLSSAVAGPMLVVGAPELAHEVLHAPPGTYLTGAANRRILPVLPENSVLTLDGEPHRQRRRELAPMFHGDRLKAIAPVIRGLAAREVEGWPLGRPFAVLPRMRSLALSVAVRLILGIEDSAGVAQVERHLRGALRPYAMLSGISGLARLGPLSPQAAAARGHRAFARGLADAVRCPRDPGDEMSVPELLGPDEVFALLLAAHETTATGLAWAIELLAWAPHAADAVARELPGPERPSLDAVIWESLRLRPPLVDIVRQANAPVRLAGRNIPAGALLLIPPPLIHQEAATEDGDSFEIARFRDNQPPDPHTWLPFGGGERRCLGASLAMLELREILPQIIERFELRPTRPEPERPRLYGTALVPATGACVVLSPRRK